MTISENLGMAILTGAWEAIKADPMSQAGLAHAVACKARPGGCESDDVHQAALVGLLEAVERFDPLQGNAFSTYATWWIQREVKALYVASTPIKVRGDHYWSAIKATRRAEHPEALPSTMTPAASLDAARVDDGRTLGDSLGVDGDQEAAAGQAWAMVAILDLARSLLSKQTHKRAVPLALTVLAYRIAAPVLGYEAATLQECADPFEATRERARQVERDLLAALASRVQP